MTKRKGRALGSPVRARRARSVHEGIERQAGYETGAAAKPLLLDTHTIIWWAMGDRRLPIRCREAIANEDARILVSAASAWEIATKARLGKLQVPSQLLGGLADYLAEQEFETLAVSIEHGQRAGSLPGPHRDPFDRMLIAQAQAENLTIVSNERAFDAYGVTRLW